MVSIDPSGGDFHERETVAQAVLAERKVEVVRRHLVGKEAVSDLADELEVQPTQIRLWIKQVLDQAEAASTMHGKRHPRDHQLGTNRPKLYRILQRANPLFSVTRYATRHLR